MNLSIHLKIAGGLLLLLAFAHLFFPKRFGWKADLAQLTLLNRQVFLVHAFFITLVLVLFGVLSLAYTDSLLQPGQLARIVLTGLVVFWAARLFIQFFIYDSRLWKGNRFNTVMHVFFSLMWGYYVSVYTIALYRQYQQ